MAWGLLAAIAFVTLGPIHDRPQTGYPQAERFGAYLLLGIVFGLAYPRYRLWVALGIVAAAAGLEVGQLFVPHRDAHVADATAKALGGIAGVVLAAGACRLSAVCRRSWMR